MLILDKQKAVERMVELTCHGAAPPTADSVLAIDTTEAHARTYQRVATYERRSTATTPARKAERRRRKTRMVDGPAPA